MTEAISSFGTLLQMSDGGTPDVYTTIGEIRDISGAGVTLDMEEVTNQSSTDGWAEKIATILSADDISFGINYKPTGATHRLTTGLLGLQSNRTLRNFKLVFPDGLSTNWVIPARVAKFTVNAPVRGALTADCTLSPSGKPTLA